MVHRNNGKTEQLYLRFFKFIWIDFNQKRSREIYKCGVNRNVQFDRNNQQSGSSWILETISVVLAKHSDPEVRIADTHILHIFF